MDTVLILLAMNIRTIETPAGWKAWDEDTYDGAEPFAGWGDTEQEAIDDLCDLLGKPYSMKADEEKSP